MKDLVRIVGLSRSTIYAKLRKDGTAHDPGFPQRIPLSGTSAVGFDLEEVERWCELQIAKRAEAQS